MIHTESIINYLAGDKEDRDLRFQLLTTGLTEIKHWEKMVAPKEFFTIIFGKDSSALFEHLALHAGLINRLSRARDMKQYKTIILAYNKEIINAQSIYQRRDDNIVNYFREYLQEMMNACAQNEGAVEISIITGCSIIAPYAGTIRKPFMSTIVRLDDDDYEEDEPDDVAALENDTSSIQLKDLALSYMERMVKIHPTLDTLLHNSSMYEHIGGREELGSVMEITNFARGDMEVPTLYYAWAYFYQNADILATEQCQELLRTLRRPMEASYDKLLQACMDVTPASEGALLSELETYDTLSKYMKRPDEYLDKFTAMDHDPTALFDLDILMNYIYTNRRFRSNEYVRTRFMTVESIGDYVFYKTYVLIVPRNSDGDDSPFLYVPVIDDLNGSQPAVIKFWRDGRIEVLSENEFNREVGNVR